MSNVVYLDHNATTQPSREVVEEMLECLSRAWANPSSTHEPGQSARRVLSDARARVATFLGCQGAELVFTSGATEANHAALLGALALGRRTGRTGVVMSAVEHPGLIALARRLDAEGVPVAFVPVSAQGELDLARARELITPEVAVVSVMGANNETGVLMPVAALARLAHGVGALLHVDATQLVGKAVVRFDASGADLWSCSAHKINGPKGVGALVVRKGIALPPLFAGRQERNRRGGTENLPGIVGFAAAAARAAQTLADDVARIRALRVELEAALQAALPEVHVYGAAAERLCNTSCLRFGTLDAEQVLGKLERAGIVASSGAACTAGGTQPSHVLLAMGEPALHARAGVRLSLGRETSAADIHRTIDACVRAIGPLLAEPVAEAVAEAVPA